MPKYLTTTVLVTCALMFLGIPSSAFAHWGSPVSFRAPAPLDVSVDSNGDVFVAEFFGFGGIDEFDPSHSLLVPPSPFGSGNGAHSGVAVDPANGNVYAVNASGQTVDVYDSASGALLSTIPVPGSENFPGLGTLVQIASDAAGNVYVPNAPHNEVQVFAPNGGTPGGVAATIAGTGSEALSAPIGVAVAPSGDIWVADAGNGRIEEFDPSGGFLKQIATPGVLAVAADAAGDVFASVEDSSGAHVLEYNAAGVKIDDFGLGTIGGSEGFGVGGGIAIDETNNVVYVADFQNEAVWAFVLAPEVTTTAATGTQQTTATVNGHVDPAGGGDIVSCEFEYGTGQAVPCSPAPPYSGPQDVSAEITGLKSGTEYHYRVRAANVKGSSHGEEESFITPGPALESETAEARSRDAKLIAEINPRGADTTCDLQYVNEREFSATGYANATIVPCSPTDLGTGSTEVSADVSLTGLEANTSYHYRFVVSNASGTATGADQVFATFGIESFTFGVSDENEHLYTQAGGHPYELTDTFAFSTTTAGGHPGSAGANTKDVYTELPPGLVGNPEATSKCEPYNVAHANCSGSSQVGILTVFTAGSPAGKAGKEAPIYNLVPPAGVAAQFGARFNGFVTAHIDAKVRTGGDYGVTSDALYVSAAEGVTGVSVTLWGVPNDPSHDHERYCPRATHINEELSEPGAGFFCTSGAPLVPFLTNPTSCSGPLSVGMAVDTWQEPGSFISASTGMPGVTGCDRPNFSPSISVVPESSSTSSPTGLQVDLHIPQNENPSGLAEANLKNAVVTLPEGVTVNPSSANGLQACSPAQIELHGPEPAGCPDASKVGSVEIDTPLLDRPVKGGVYVATPNDNPFGSLLAIYIAAYDPVSGVVVKVAGHVEADPATGRLTTRFDQNPQLPFDDLKVDFFGGPRASLVTPESCGTFTASTDLTPWTSPEGADAFPSSSFQVGQGCGPRGFAPAFSEGTVSSQAGAFSPLTLTFSRGDGEQQFKGFEETLPPGLLAKLAGIPLCTDAQAGAGECPEASRIGTVTVLAGVGSDPVSVQGRVYLTSAYNGGAFGEVVEVPAVAGPFNLGVVVVRGSIRINPVTAQASVVSDQFPSILDGIPLLVKTVNVILDRPGFTFNPTSCQPMRITGALSSTNGTSTPVSSAFQVANCATLGFKPSFTAATQGKTSKASGASLTVKVKPTVGQANIAKVSLQLPKQLPARLTTLQKACTEKQFALNPAGCPEASDIGTARAITPLLNSPLVGPAYLVSHGGAAFPDVEFILQGEGVTIDLDGKTQIKKGITYSHFETVPDAPITSFETTLPEGPHSVLATDLPASDHNSLCGVALNLPTTITAQNGAVITQTTKAAVTGCAKKKTLTRAQKLAASLRACKKKAKSKRAECSVTARKRYGPRG